MGNLSHLGEERRRRDSASPYCEDGSPAAPEEAKEPRERRGAADERGDDRGQGDVAQDDLHEGVPPSHGDAPLLGPDGGAHREELAAEVVDPLRPLVVGVGLEGLDVPPELLDARGVRAVRAMERSEGLVDIPTLVHQSRVDGEAERVEGLVDAPTLVGRSRVAGPRRCGRT